MGLGIHGEPGVARVAFAGADATVDALLDVLMARLVLPVAAGGGSGGGERRRGDVVLMVNALGGTTPLEASICARAAVAGARARGLHVSRLLVGAFVTALDMSGVSLTLLPVDAARLALIDAPMLCGAWPWRAAEPPGAPAVVALPAEAAEGADGALGAPGGPALSPQVRVRTGVGISDAVAAAQARAVLRECVRGACEAVLDAEGEATRLDSIGE